MQVKAGDIFECEGSFYQAIKATAKTATIRPIESTFEGLADAYGWERKYMPLPNCFTYDPIMGREWKTFEDFKRDLEEYIVHWNTSRRQVRLKGLTPEEYRNQALAA